MMESQALYRLMLKSVELLLKFNFAAMPVCLFRTCMTTAMT